MFNVIKWEQRNNMMPIYFDNIVHFACFSMYPEKLIKKEYANSHNSEFVHVPRNVLLIWITFLYWVVSRYNGKSAFRFLTYYCI